MNDSSPDPRLAIGANNPPVSIIEDLTLRYRSLLDQFAELTDAAQQAPDKIDNDIIHAKVLELIKKMRVLEKQADATREIEREPFKQKVDEINGFFKSRIDPMKALRERLNERHETYSKAKAEAEKRRLEEEAERRRIESERLLREAEAAEARQREAEKARLEEERKARDAEEAKLRAIYDRKRAEEAAEKARLEGLRLADERKQMEAEEAERRRLAKLQQAKDEADAASRKEQERIDREAHEARMAEMRAQEDAAKEARRKADEEAAESKRRADEERRKQREAEDAADASKREEKSADRDSRSAFKAAEHEDKRATRIEEKVDGPEADLARSRSEHGAVGTLARRWTCRVIDRDKLDVRAIWPFVNGEAVDAALWKWMMAQKPEDRQMAGAVIEQETFGSVR